MNQPTSKTQYASRSGEKREPLSVMLPPRINNYIRRLAKRRKTSISVIAEELLDEAIFGKPETDQASA